MIAVAAAYTLIVLWDISLRDPRYFDGWLLFALMGLQFTYHVRRGNIGRSLAAASRWMKLHIYAGYLVVAVFLIHTDFALPDSLIEWVLWALFMAVGVSGVIGAYFSATIPGRLELQAQGIEFDAIPQERDRLAREVHQLINNTANHPNMQVLTEFYVSTLYDFFDKPRDVLRHMQYSTRPLARLTRKLDGLEKYLDPDGRQILQVVRRLVVSKSYLDFQYAQQLLLQAWLFVHVPATYGLIAVTVLHVIHVYAFTTGVP